MRLNSYTTLQPNVFNIEVHNDGFPFSTCLQHSCAVWDTVKKAEEKAIFLLNL